MNNLLIKAIESITPTVLNRFVSFGHNIDGSHKGWKDVSNYPSFSAAVDACGASGSKPCVLAFSKTYDVTGHKTIPPHVSLMPVNGGKLNITGAFIVTLNGNVYGNPMHQWIDGTGTIVFGSGSVTEVFAEWWGDPVDGTDASSAIMAALAATVSNNIPVRLSSGDHGFDGQLTLVTNDELIGYGIGSTTLTRLSGATGNCIQSGATADNITLKDFTLDCDFEGASGIKMGFGGSILGGLSRIENVFVKDCAGIGVHIDLDKKVIIRNLQIDNVDGGGVGTHQLKLEGGHVDIFGLRITGETGTTANIEFAGDNCNIFGMYMEDPHLTKSIRFNGDNNTITGLNIVTEDNTITYTQLIYTESGATRNLVRDISVEKGATDTITNLVQDDQESQTIVFDADTSLYIQYDRLQGSEIVQKVYTSTGAVASNATTIPVDDVAPPQITEGSEYLSRTITPRNTANILRIDVLLNMSNSGASDRGTASLFKDSVVDSKAVGAIFKQDINVITPVRILYFVAAGSVSLQTWTVRAGFTAGTTTVNGESGARKYAGTLFSVIEITELKLL